MKINFIHHLIFIGLIFQLTNSSMAQNFSVDIFPETKIYHLYSGDALSPNISLSKHFESSEWFGNIGGILPIANFYFDERIFQLSLACAVFNSIIFVPPHVKVFTVDYLVDSYLDTKLSENWNFRFNWGHLSAHFSDDGIIELQKYPINYVRDYISLQSELLIPQINGKAYLSTIFNFHNEPDRSKKTTFQLGGDIGYYIHSKVLIYFAFDLKIKSAVNNATTQSFQIGIKYPTLSRVSARLAFTHRRGFEERGQLYQLNDIKNTLGLYFDF